VPGPVARRYDPVFGIDLDCGGDGDFDSDGDTDFDFGWGLGLGCMLALVELCCLIVPSVFAVTAPRKGLRSTGTFIRREHCNCRPGAK
jgi:hypothetical protein